MTQHSLNGLIDAIENNKIDYILGDLSSLESTLRGNELFRGVLKVAGITRSEFIVGPGFSPITLSFTCSLRFTASPASVRNWSARKNLISFLI